MNESVAGAGKRELHRPEAPGFLIGDDGIARPLWATDDAQLRHYYDTEWGFPVTDERGLFERLCLEVFQSGLSWATILAKRPAFRRAFADFDPEIIAGWGRAERERLLNDQTIVRNRRKIDATLQNARACINLRAHGGLVECVWQFASSTPLALRSHPEASTHTVASRELAFELKRHGFQHVGPVTMQALLDATGVAGVREQAAPSRQSVLRDPTPRVPSSSSPPTSQV